METPDEYEVAEIAPMLRDSVLGYAMGSWFGYKPAGHHRKIAAKLEAVERGEIKRLMIFMPPRAGKSMLVSEYFPAWYIGRQKDKQIIHCTYAQDLADGFGRKIRNQISDPLYQTIFGDVRLLDDSQAANRFHTTNGNVYHAVGAGGPITGRGAHCVVVGTLVRTVAGLVPIENLEIGTPSGIILTWNELRGCHEFKQLQAVTSRQADGIYRITTAQGRVLEVTGNHRVFVDGEYVRADQLSAGHPLLCVLPEGSSKTGVCLHQDSEARTQGPLLRQSVFGSASRGKERKTLRGLRESCRSKRELSWSKVLQRLSPTEGWAQGAIPADTADMPDMQRRVQCGVAWDWCRRLCQVLHQAVLGDWTFKANVLRGQPKMEAWCHATAGAALYGESLPANAKACVGSRRTSMRGVQDYRETACSSHRQLADEQFGVESGDSVRILSREMAFSDGLASAKDTVAMVERVHQAATVYDIQVADNHNFFAGDILVHNCLLIDDPIKGREDADSPVMRQKLKDWYTSVAYTRLMPDAAVVIINTRWHSDDLSGWLLKEHAHENWDVLTLPAINDKGEALWPDAYPLHRLKQIRRAVGERDWAALYQQSPTVDGGNILKKHWWRIWPDGKKLPTCDHVFLSWDTAYSDKAYKENSHSAMTAWGVFWDEPNDRNALILLKTWNGQVDYPELRAKAKELDKELEPDCHLIEKKASGQSLIQDMRRIPGVLVKPYNPDKDKVTRAYSVQAMLESGQVYVPDRRWAESLVEQVSQFPNGAPPSSDYTDTVTQALIYLRNGWWVENPNDKIPPPLDEAANLDAWDEDEDESTTRRLYG